jgi:hypothetical protein
MGLFSSKKITNVQQTTNLQQELNQTFADYGTLEGESAKTTALVSAQDSSVNLSILDGGAIKASYKFAESALGTVEEALTNAKIAQMEGYSMAQDVLEGVISTQQSEATNVMLNVIKWGVLAVAIVTVAWTIKQRK